MKLTSLKSCALAIALTAAAVLPNSSHAAYAYRGTEANSLHSVVNFNDGANFLEAFWLLHSGAAGATLGVSTAGGSWAVRGFPNSSGEMILIWQNVNSSQLSIWRYSATGVLLSASTFSLQHDNPWRIRSIKPMGGKLVISFTQDADTRQGAAWLIGSGGNIEKTFAWVAPTQLGGGFHLEEAFTFFNLGNEFLEVDGSNGFIVNLLSDTQYTTYTFDADGNWIAANTYTF